MRTDDSLLSLLRRDPEAGMAGLIDAYSGLLWTVCRRVLDNEEDVKECVNESFAAFYLRHDRFDPEKGSLKGYLAVIARRCAIRRYHENRRAEIGAAAYAEEEDEDPFARAERRDELERALAALDPLDEQILCMKYYRGMTAREIAETLGLSYETVKKRHQRSLKKLLKSISVGMAVAAILALLAACAYLVLRHFGFVPGYGVNTNPDAPIYMLEEKLTAAAGGYELSLEDAWWREESFLADLTLRGSEERLSQLFLDASLSGLDGVRTVSVSRGAAEHGEIPYRLIFEGGLPEGTGDVLSLTLTVNGTPLPLTLTAAEESAISEAGFYSMTEEDGGLLAVPRLEDGELIVSIHPLNEGEFRTYPFLNGGVWAGYGGEELPVTVTAPDGSVLEGEAELANPFSGDSYLDWYFGPAEPGEYVLHVPYVYQYAASDSEKITIELALTEEESRADVSLALPGGTLRLGRLFPIDSPAAYAEGLSLSFGEAGYRWWALEADWESENPERTAAAAPLQAVSDGEASEDGVFWSSAVTGLWTAGSDSEPPVTLVSGYVIGARGGLAGVTLSAAPETVCYRWDHPFDIPMKVQAESDELP